MKESLGLKPQQLELKPKNLGEADPVRSYMKM